MTTPIFLINFEETLDTFRENETFLRVFTTDEKAKECAQTDLEDRLTVYAEDLEIERPAASIYWQRWNGGWRGEAHYEDLDLTFVYHVTEGMLV